MKGFEDKIVKAYCDYMVEIALIFGADRLRAERELKDSLDFEIALAKVSYNDLISKWRLCVWPIRSLDYRELL